MKRWIFVEGDEKADLELMWFLVDTGFWDVFRIYHNESNLELSC